MKKKWLLWIDNNFEMVLMFISIWVIVAIMGLQIIMRYFFQSSLSWAEELSRYFFIWFAFIGMSYAIHNDSHIRIDIIETKYPQSRKYLSFIGDVFFLGFCIFMIIPGIDVINGLIETKQTSPAMELSMYFVYFSLLIGLLLSIFRLLQKYFLIYTNKYLKNKVGA